mmetsp:Transcript_34980/g.76518  ORF Transcript_34980/g.76518 Transcript_34980/m.76518 type:complete len:83 (+) Transcript_34980:1036-1284(+)
MHFDAGMSPADGPAWSRRYVSGTEPLGTRGRRGRASTEKFLRLAAAVPRTAEALKRRDDTCSMALIYARFIDLYLAESDDER